MNKDLLTVGIVAAGGLVALAYATRQTTTSYGVDAGSASAVNAIAAANTAAIDAGAKERELNAQLATQYETAINNNQTTVTTAQIAAETTRNVAALGAETQVASATINAQRDETLAGINAQAQEMLGTYSTRLGINQSNNALTASETQSNDALSAAQAQASAQKTSSFWNFLGNLTKTVTAAFTG